MLVMKIIDDDYHINISVPVEDLRIEKAIDPDVDGLLE
jgi:hypothetical protein